MAQCAFIRINTVSISFDYEYLKKKNYKALTIFTIRILIFLVRLKKTVVQSPGLHVMIQEKDIKLMSIR